MSIILASTSIIRRKLLENAGIKLRVEKPEIDEEHLKSLMHERTPDELAMELAKSKAVSLSKKHTTSTIVGADQILEFQGNRFDKPRNRSEAREQLLTLNGKTHRLVSAIACASAGTIEWSYSEEARLTMRNSSSAFLDSYLDHIGKEASHSVGGYKLESRGIQLFDKIEGDYFAILGLPLLPLLRHLRGIGELSS